MGRMSQGSSEISHTLVLHCNSQAGFYSDVLGCSPSKQETRVRIRVRGKVEDGYSNLPENYSGSTHSGNTLKSMLILLLLLHYCFTSTVNI